jgi:hypothetical protein
MKVLCGFSKTETEHMPTNKPHHAHYEIEQCISSSAEMSCQSGAVIQALIDLP